MASNNDIQKMIQPVVSMIQKGQIPNILTLINTKVKPITIEKKTSGTIVDVNDEFKGFMNKFVINNLLQNEESKMRFLNLIARVFNSMIDEYNKKFMLSGNKSVIFLYKGGNLLRIFYKRFLSNYSADSVVDVSELINEVFSPDFGKSDDDFTILINPKLASFRKIYSDMNYLSYTCLEIIRSELQTNRKYYFDYFNLTDNMKIITLMKSLKTATDASSFKTLSNADSPYNGFEIVGILLDNIYAPMPPADISMENFMKIVNGQNIQNGQPALSVQSIYLSELHPVEYPTYKSVESFVKFDVDVPQSKIISGGLYSTTNNMTDIESSARNDFFIIPRSNYSQVYPSITTDKNLMNLSHNTIEFKGPAGEVSFALNRSKLNARLYLKKTTFGSPDQLIYITAPGELIDVTIARQNDNGLNYMYNTALSHNLTEYVFTYGNDQFILKGYSFDYLIHDLEYILFDVTDNQPWTDNKYEKRLKRLMLLQYFKSLAKYGPNDAEKLFSNISKYMTDANGCFKTNKSCKMYVGPLIPDQNPMHDLMMFVGNLYNKVITGKDVDPNITTFLDTTKNLSTNVYTISKAIRANGKVLDIDQARVQVLPNYLGGKYR